MINYEADVGIAGVVEVGRCQVQHSSHLVLEYAVIHIIGFETIQSQRSRFFQGERIRLYDAHESSTINLQNSSCISGKSETSESMDNFTKKDENPIKPLLQS